MYDVVLFRKNDSPYDGMIMAEFNSFLNAVSFIEDAYPEFIQSYSSTTRYGNSSVIIFEYDYDEIVVFKTEFSSKSDYWDYDDRYNNDRYNDDYDDYNDDYEEEIFENLFTIYFGHYIDGMSDDDLCYRSNRFFNHYVSSLSDFKPERNNWFIGLNLSNETQIS